MMRRAAFSLILVLLIPAPEGAGAIEVCRPNTLGQIVCSGRPTHGLDPIEPFTPRKSGVSRVQPRPEAKSTAPGFAPARRTNAFGDTLPAPGEAPPPPRPRICHADELGNMRCP